MHIVTIEKILEEQGKTVYWLASATGINYQKLLKIYKNQTSSIHFSTVEKICKALNCTPNDIIKIE